MGNVPELDAQIVTVQNYVHKKMGVAKSLDPKNKIAQTTIGKDFLSHDTGKAATPQAGMFLSKASDLAAELTSLGLTGG